MLTRIDRLQMAVPDRRTAAEGWIELLGAEIDGEDRVACLGASRTRCRVGRGWLELLEPDGTGVVADSLAKRGAHLFAAGAATADVGLLVSHLQGLGVEPTVEGGQAFVDPAAAGDVPYRTVLSPDEDLERVGAVDFFYETTLLVENAQAAAGRCAALFGLDDTAFVPIDSEHYGYSGSLTLFDPDRLDRFEVITPNDLAKTMGRFFSRVGEAYYMAFAESDQLLEIEERARERGLGFTAEPKAAGREGPPHTVFLHPATLGGMMLGLSGPTIAWRWSGHPERVVVGS